MGEKLDITSTEIDGVTTTNLSQINDSRGSVLHMLRSDAEDFISFGECYFSEVLPGAVKAWKYHYNQTQNITVPVGRIRIVIYDNRELSLTHGKILILEIGRPDAYIRIHIPPELWYGFRCISSSPALLVNCADIPHHPKDSKILEKDDDSIPYFWDK